MQDHLSKMWIRHLGAVLTVGFLAGCAEVADPAPDSTEFARLAGRVQMELQRGLPDTVPLEMDMGRIHNEILAQFERRHSFDHPQIHPTFVDAYTAAANAVLERNGVNYVVTAGAVDGFVDLFNYFHKAHGLSAPAAVLGTLEDEDLITGEEHDVLLRVIEGAEVMPRSAVVSWGSQVRRASYIYWRDSGRLGGGSGSGFGHGTEGWLRDLFVVGADAVGGMIGGLAGGAAGTGLGGPVGGAVGASIGGPLVAGAFSGLAIVTLECTCQD